jgi:glycosyltransferase involved in cell wall biosynthesis
LVFTAETVTRRLEFPVIHEAMQSLSAISDKALDRPSVVLIADFPFHPATSGNTKRVASLVAEIRSWGYRIHFLGLGSKWPISSCDAIRGAVDSFEMFEWTADLDPYGLPSPKGAIGRLLRWSRRQVLKLIGRWPPPLDPDLAERCPNAFCDWVQRKLEVLHPVAVIAEYLWMSRSLQRANAPCLKIIDLHDLMHVRLKEYRGSKLSSFFQCTLEDELRCMQRANCVLAIQELDKEILDHHLSDVTVLHVPHGHPLQNHSSPPGKRLVFIGSAHAANVEGMGWFLDRIWPAIHALDPSIRLDIVGNCCIPLNERIEDASGTVTAHGLVSKPDEILTSCDIMINPILRGSGLKIKVVEAMCAGLGIVSTQKGMEGIRDAHSCDAIAIADDPDGFAAATVRLANSPISLVGAAQDFAEKRFSSTAAYAALKDYLSSHLAAGKKSISK